MTYWEIASPFVGATLVLLAFWFWKPWAGAYASENGKNLARKEDLDAILAEVRAVTIAQKEIEHKLSGDLWHRQTVPRSRVVTAEIKGAGGFSLT
jgi:membrane protein implicated in regulation of membrane protease activity